MSKTPVTQVALLAGAISTGAGSPFDVSVYDQLESENRTVVANVSGTGIVSATVVVEVSNNSRHWIALATISLLGTTSASDGLATDELWQYVRGNVTAISGTGAAVTLTMAV